MAFIVRILVVGSFWILASGFPRQNIQVNFHNDDNDNNDYKNHNNNNNNMHVGFQGKIFR